jgi:hypothetical protein
VIYGDCRSCNMRRGLVFAEELFGVLNEADEDDNGGSDQAHKEHGFEEFHTQDRDGEHASILARFRWARNQDGMRRAGGEFAVWVPARTARAARALR